MGKTVEKILYLHQGDSHWAKGDQEAGHRGEIVCSKILMELKLLGGKTKKEHPPSSSRLLTLGEGGSREIV